MKVGSHHSEETKRRMRDKANRDPRPPEVRQKIAESKLTGNHPYRGKSLSPEHRKRISEGMRKRNQQTEVDNDQTQ